MWLLFCAPIEKQSLLESLWAGKWPVLIYPFCIQSTLCASLTPGISSLSSMR